MAGKLYDEKLLLPICEFHSRDECYLVCFDLAGVGRGNTSEYNDLFQGE